MIDIFQMGVRFRAPEELGLQLLQVVDSVDERIRLRVGAGDGLLRDIVVDLGPQAGQIDGRVKEAM